MQCMLQSVFLQAISCHYAASECHYIQVEGSTQQNIADEVKDLAEKKLGKELASGITYQVRLGFCPVTILVTKLSLD